MTLGNSCTLAPPTQIHWQLSCSLPLSLCPSPFPVPGDRGEDQYICCLMGGFHWEMRCLSILLVAPHPSFKSKSHGTPSPWQWWGRGKAQYSPVDPGPTRIPCLTSSHTFAHWGWGRRVSDCGRASPAAFLYTPGAVPVLAPVLADILNLKCDILNSNLNLVSQ